MILLGAIVNNWYSNKISSNSWWMK
jgi:hypothetical protein